MKRYLRIFLIFIFCLLFFGLTKSVNANSINKISMDVYIDNSGNATITETWNCKVTKGTEVYHPYYNLGNSSITNLTVTDNGKEYQTLSSWNTSGSLESKANKCGINRISNGVELCWGISSYGTHTYTVKYIINNFIYGLSDSSQMLYWTFIPYDFSDSIGSVYIKVHTDFNISQDVDVWGYGNYGGTAYVYDGYIEMQSSGSLSSDEYMTMLVKFPAESFNTDNMLDYDFNYYYNMAEEGATHYTKEDDESIWVIIISALVTFFPILVSIGLVGMLNGSKELNFGKEGKKIPKDIPYYRDIPCDKDVFKAYYIGYNYG
ncbi:MAG: DUF2207 domain-containing protein, partial [Clostridia bacterium]|nr:DUF2207 domain-containing protein [Clostridia bacterium]